MYFEDYEKAGFIKTKTPRGIQYSASSEIGQGGFTLLGDITTCYASISDTILKKDLVFVESINEKFLQFCNYDRGDSLFYKVKKKPAPFDYGLNFYLHDRYLTGYMRIKANSQMICNGLILREKFFKELPFKLPDDFWETASSVLNPDIVDHPKLFEICNQIKNCQLTGSQLDMYIHGKGLESLALIIDYVYKQKRPPLIRFSPEDRQILKAAQEILEENWVKPPTIPELSRLVGTNQQKLTLRFKQLTGSTINNFIKRLRMEKAAEYLQQTDLRISQIAKDVGYHGDGHFQKAFVSIYGVTPSVFRKDIPY